MIAAEAQQLGGFVGQAVAQPLLSAGVLLSVASYMLWIEPQVALVAFAFFFPSLLTAPWLQERINRYSKERTELLHALGLLVRAGGRPAIKDWFRIRLRSDHRGFSLQTAVRCAVQQRQRLEQLCRYVTRRSRNANPPAGPAAIAASQRWPGDPRFLDGGDARYSPAPGQCSPASYCTSTRTSHAPC